MLTLTQLLKKFPTFFGTGRFITVFTTACHWSLILNQTNRVHTFSSYFPKIHSNIILPSTPRSSAWSPPFRVSDWNVCMSHVMRATCPTHLILDLNTLMTFGEEQNVMKQHITQSSSASHHFLPLTTKYSPQHPVLKHPQSTLTLIITMSYSHLKTSSQN
jgi:hypothetical protein